MLSFDIHGEIIKRLPVKSVIQFRSVCKGWKSLIDSSRFIAGYNVYLEQAHHLMIRYEVGQYHEVKYVSIVDDDTFPQQKFPLAVPVPPPVQANSTTIIIGSSHGLLCLTCFFWEPDYSRKTKMALLWNPTIRKSIAVVVPDNNIDDQSFSYVVGFGVCPDTMDPKLVRITYIHDYRKIESISCIPCQVMVFTLSSREWTTSSCISLPRKSIGFTWSQTVIGQFIYWLAFDWILVGVEFRNLIMSFDMSTQEFREINLPDSLAGMPPLYLCVSRVRESLVLVNHGTDLWKGGCSVWMMEHGDSEVFTKLFTVLIPNVSVSRILGFRKSGEPIVELHGDERDYDTPCAPLFVYEPGSKHIKNLGIHEKGYALFGSSYIGYALFGITYMESLLLLDYDAYDGHIVKCGAVKR